MDCHLKNVPLSVVFPVPRTWLIVLLVHSMLPHLGTIAIAPFIHALAVQRHLPFEDVISQGEPCMRLLRTRGDLKQEPS